MSVFFLFLVATTVGLLTTLFWIPEEDLGRGYFQINALIVLGLVALALVVAATSLEGIGGRPRGYRLVLLALALAAAFLYYAAVWRRRWRFGRLPLLLAFGAAVGALLLTGPELVSAGPPLPYRRPLLVTGLLSSSLLLGWSVTTMLLGHWYLVVPRLTFRYLVVFCWVLLGAVALRLGAVGASLIAAAGVEPMIEPHPLRLLVGFGGQGMFFWFRLVWGLAIPLLLAAMALACARRRSNQSATGILYVLVVASFVGEITGLYLTVTTGVPV